MPAVTDVLIIGGGAAGPAAAILLAEAGVSVDLLEARSTVDALGSGITLQGNALRVFGRLGVWEQIQEHGYPFDSLGFRAPDADGTLLVELPDARTGGPEYPATTGMYRPKMASILIDRARALGATIVLGTTCTELVQDASGVEAVWSDGTSHHYDLVIGADGIRSNTRQQIGIDLQPQPTGMGIWRAFTTRPAEITRTDLVYGGRCYIAGYCPTGDNSIYAYLVEDAQERGTLTPAESLAVMRELAADYHGPWDAVRESLTDPDRINYTRFETHMLEPPWHRGRVVLAGDAVHSCPPTLAQGAAQALEDAVVLADLLIAADTLDDALLTTYALKRYDRAKTVVDASLQLGQWLLDHEQGDVPGLMGRVAHLLSEPV